MHERDRQTDGRTDGQTDIGPQQNPRLRTASRGNEYEEQKISPVGD